MDDAGPNESKPAQIDFPLLWFFVRGAQTLSAFFFVRVIYLARGGADFEAYLLSAVGVVLLLFFVLRGIATGSVSDSGIAYRVYFREKTVPWESVEAIEWLGYRLKVIVKRVRKEKSIIVFLLNPLKSLGPYWAHRLGAEVLPPKILERIRALPIERTPEVTSAPTYPKWVFWTGLAVVGCFILVVLWRLLAAAPSGSH